MSLAKQGKRQVPKFEDQATVEETKVEEPAVAETPEEVVEEVQKEEVETLDSILGTVTEKPKPIPKEQISVYLDKDVKQAFEKFGKRYGKGAKSELVNNFLKKLFIKE